MTAEACHHAQPPAAGGDRRPRLDVRLGRGRHGQDDRARRAVRPRRDRRRPRRRLAARHHLHRSRRRRAAGADPGPAARARAARSGARPRRRLDLDDPRLLPPAPDRVPARRRHRPAVPRARRVAGAGAAGRGVQRRPGGVLRRRRARPLAAARDLQGRRAPQDARQRLRHAALGRPQADPRAGGAREPRRRRRRAAAPRSTSLLADGKATEHDALGRARRARSAPDDAPAGAPDRASRRRRSAARAPQPSAMRARPCGRSRSRSSPRATASCCRSSSPASPRPTPRRRTASRRSTSRTCSSAPASCCARTTSIREVEQLRFRSIMVDEFQDTNKPPDRPRRPALRRPDEGAVLRRRRVPVDLRLPPRRRRGVPRPARGGAAGAAADAQLPLAARGARCRQRAVRRRVRRELPGADAGRRLRRPGLRDAVRAARHRQGVVRRLGRPLAPRRGAARRPPRPRARRRGRRHAGRDRPPLRRRNRRRVVRGGAARASTCRRSG